MIWGRSDSVVNRGARSILVFLAGKTLILALLLGAAIGLAALAARPAGPGAQAAHVGPPGSGITARVELADIWIPKKLHELARRHSEDPIPLSHEALQLELKREGCENLWYALTSHHIQVDGRVSEITTIEYPDQLSGSHRFLDLLEVFLERQPRSADSKLSSPNVHIIPEEMLSREPRAALEELMR